MKCVVIDAGNTSAGIGFWEDGKVSHISSVRGGVRNWESAVDALKRAFSSGSCPAILASVVPSDDAAWSDVLTSFSGEPPVILSHETPMPIGIRYPNPAQIGADRFAGAVGAFSRYGGPVVTADFGTALTFDVVDADGCYTGGVIAPGLPLMTEYLHERTAKLPLVSLGGELPQWGDSTENAMLIGARVGYRGIVREILKFITEKTNGKIRCCATGGYAGWALKDSGMDFIIDPDLTLYGLGVIYAYSH